MSKVKERYVLEVNGDAHSTNDDDLDGRQVRSIAGYDPAADHRLIRVHDRYTESIGLERPVELEAGVKAVFRCFEGDLDYPFTVDDRGWEWGAPSISEVDVRRIGKIADDRDLVVTVAGRPDAVVPRGGSIDLSGRGVERIYARRAADRRKLSLIFVVNGVPTPVEARSEERLADVLAKALRKSQNTGQPADAWQVTDEPGNVLDPERTLAELGIQDGAVLLASLKAGAAG